MIKHYQHTSLPYAQLWLLKNVKGCVRYIFASLFIKSKGEQLGNKEKKFLFHFKRSFRSQENQILEFRIFKFYKVIKCLSTKQGIHFTE